MPLLFTVLAAVASLAIHLHCNFACLHRVLLQNNGDLCTLVSTLYGYNSEVLCTAVTVLSLCSDRSR